MKDKTRPSVRFPGFEDDWEQREFNEVFDLNVPNNTYSRDKLNYEGGKVKNIHYGDILTKFDSVLDFENPDIPYINQEFEDKIQNQLLKDGDIIFADTAEDETTGKVTEIRGVGDKSIVSGLHTVVCRPIDEYSSGFLGYYMNSDSFHDKLKPLMQGIKVLSISRANLQKIELCLPTEKEEQEKVSEFFSQLDQTITLHQQKLDDLKELKSGLLQKMFPQKGEKVPQVRFPGFTGDWEQYKLSEVAERFDNLRIPVAENLRVKGSNPYYGANGIQDYVEGFTHQGEFVLVAEDGASDLNDYPIFCVNGDIWVNNHAHVLQIKPGKGTNQFLSRTLKQTDIKSILVGGGRAKLNADTMMKLVVMMPSLNEQKQIGSFFEQLDTTITLHQQKIDDLNQLKSGLLQKMFP